MGATLTVTETYGAYVYNFTEQEEIYKHVEMLFEELPLSQSFRMVSENSMGVEICIENQYLKV